MTTRQASSRRPLLFLDLDDVLVLNLPGDYGGYDVLAPNPPADIWSRVIHEPAKQVLLEVLEAWSPAIVMTTSWIRFMDRDACRNLFLRTGLAKVAEALHAAWEAPQLSRQTRCDAIDSWLGLHHVGEPYVILDDELSGTGLVGSVHQREGRVVLCQEGIGLQRTHLPAIGVALGKRPGGPLKR